MRLGFDGIAGDVSLIASAISGSMLVDGGTVAPGQKLDLTGARQTGSTPTCTPAPCLTLSQIGGIAAGLLHLGVLGKSVVEFDPRHQHASAL